MKRVGRLVVTLAGVGAIITYAYRGPIMDMANAFKDEVSYYFSINADDALNGTIGNKDINAMASQLEGINDDVESPDWNMETATGEVFDVFLDKFPFIRETGDWIQTNILGKGEDDEGTSSEAEEGSEGATSEEGNTSEEEGTSPEDGTTSLITKESA